MKERRGLSFLEVLLAVAIAAVPLLMALSLVQRNSAHARMGADRIMGRLVAMDLMEVFLGEEIDRLREISQDPGRLGTLIEQRIARLPDFARLPYRERVLPYASRMRLTLDEEPDGGLKGLIRLTLTLDLETGTRARVEIRQLFRPTARHLPVSVQ